MNWGFFEIIKPDAIKKLIEYQDKNYHLKIDKPVLLWKPGVSKDVKYPSLDEIDKEMRKKPTKMRRVT